MAQNFTSNFSYDVFLSFRGEDTRYNFTNKLYDAFCGRGIETFFAQSKQSKNGNELSPSLFKAIKESRMFVIVFSENYASSTWCLDELVTILQCKKQNNQRVCPIFYKVDPSDIRHQRNSYGDAMAKHEERFGKGSEKVCNWRSALTKVANLKGHHFRITGYDEAKFIDDIVKKVSIMLPPKIEEHLVGLEPCLKEVISLLDISSDSTVCMLGIHGIGGIGKTTLAKALYNSIVHQFECSSFLKDVRDKGLVSLQERLLLDMLGEENIKLNNVVRREWRIKNRLRNKKVLLVLDDVNHKEQLENLSGECNWFGSGSKIIITTRDKHLLLAHRVEKTYEMKKLNNYNALQLFSWKAFHKSYPPKRFADFSNTIVNYASGHPLALKVIGSNLFGKDLDAFECALEQYKRIPSQDIQRILRKSYDDLEDYQKHIFLDIACFYKGHQLKYVENIMDACDFGPKYHIGVLVDKSWITIEYGSIQMHDLIQDMGTEVVREVAPKEPGKQSRLWLNEEIVKVLEENSGTDKIEGIMLKSLQQEIKWKGNAFERMKNLRILIVQDAYFSIGPKHLPNSLRVLEWNQFPLTALPSNFVPKKLAILQMPSSSLKLEKSFEDFKSLRVLNFSNCHSITEVPDMSRALALKELNFSGCKNLVKVHDSIGFLPKVTTLLLEFCIKLTSFPSAMQMASLEMFSINCCRSLDHFPNILGNMDCLSTIIASDTAIKELPNSIGNLPRLKELHVSDNNNLVSIPESIRKLSNLMELDVEGCKNLKEMYKIPSNLRRIFAAGCISLNLDSCRVLQSKAIKGIPDLTISMLGAQIPDWFDHCCKGRVLSFWARKNLPNALFAFIYRDGYDSGGQLNLLLFINGVEVASCHVNVTARGTEYKGYHVCWHDLNELWDKIRIEGLERYLLLEWNYVEIEVAAGSCDEQIEVVAPNSYDEQIEVAPYSHDFTIYECGIYVYKQEIRMEDVQFKSSTEMVLKNASKRGATFHPENEPPKELRRKHKPRDYRGKSQNPRTKKRKNYSVKIGDQIVPQNQYNHIDFPWERLWKLHLPRKVIIFLWELCNCVLPTSDILNSKYVQVPQICSRCGPENESSRHIFIQRTLCNCVLPTSDLLNSRYVQVPQTCSLCGVENESSQHIFIQCTFARALWFGSQLSIRPDSLEPLDVVNLIKLCLQMEDINAEIHKELTCPMALILYTIWYFRNKAIFKGETPSSEAAFKVWLRFCQKYAAVCPAIEQTNSNFTRNRAHTGSSSTQIHVPLPRMDTCQVYLSVHRVKKFTNKITYCQAFIVGDQSQMFEGNFFMSGVATKFQVLFQGIRSLLEGTIHGVPTLSIYMPSSSCIAMLNDPSMAPPHLQTIVKGVNCSLKFFCKIQSWVSKERHLQISCGSFPYSSSARVKSSSWGRISEWRFFYM